MNCFTFGQGADAGRTRSGQVQDAYCVRGRALCPPLKNRPQTSPTGTAPRKYEFDTPTGAQLTSRNLKDKPE